MSSEIPIALPFEIQQAYGLNDQATFTHLSGGLVNETILVENNERKLILRKLAPIIGRGTLDATGVVSDHLSENGWESPTIVPTVNGHMYVEDTTNKLWHGMAYIESDDRTPTEHTPDLALKAGNLLGSWHSSVEPLDFSPEGLPHFHDTGYIANKLMQDFVLLPDQTTRDLASIFLEDYRNQSTTVLAKKQLIHGDPKLDNMLYRNGDPFTLIDFDCIMRDSVWTDVGDLLRSFSGKLISADKDPADTILNFMSGYLDGGEYNLSSEEATYYALQATRRIAGELGMRYLSDIVDGQHYFSWDNTMYRSRRDALQDKAQLQEQIVRSVRSYLTA